MAGRVVIAVAEGWVLIAEERPVGHRADALFGQLGAPVGEDQSVRATVVRDGLEMADEEVVGERFEALVREAADGLHEWPEGLAAWSVLASATGQDTPAVLAAQLNGLGGQVECEFPDAWRFRRPGFDAP